MSFTKRSKKSSPKAAAAGDNADRKGTDKEKGRLTDKEKKERAAAAAEGGKRALSL